VTTTTAAKTAAAKVAKAAATAAANAAYDRAHPSATYDPNSPHQTRFPRLIWPVNPLDQIVATTKTVAALAKIIAPVATGDANVAAAGVFTVAKTGVTDTQKVPYKPDGMYYSLSMDFALGKQDPKILKPFKRGVPKPALTAAETAESAWGRAWANPLVDPSTNALYLIRVRIDQLKIEPLMAGFTLKWTLPAGWLWADGHPATVSIEVVSNPLIIIRRVISPATLKAGTKGGFVASVVKMYPGY
jgi:hypothetical protein